MDSISANLNVLIMACQKISRFVLHDFGEIEQLQSSVRGTDSFVLSYLTRIERVLTDVLLDVRPRYGVISRNFEKKGLDIAHKFIINITDGINNFKRGIPFFTISISLQEQKKIIASIIYIPALDKIYYAELGNGSYISEARMVRRIRVSPKKDLSNSSIAEVGLFKHISTANILNFGSIGLPLAYIASGTLDGYIGIKQDIFDLSAGILIIKEAGGFISAYDSNKKETNDIFSSDMIICSNNYLQEEIKDYIINK